MLLRRLPNPDGGWEADFSHSAQHNATWVSAGGFILHLPGQGWCVLCLSVCMHACAKPCTLLQWSEVGSMKNPAYRIYSTQGGGGGATPLCLCLWLAFLSQAWNIGAILWTLLSMLKVKTQQPLPSTEVNHQSSVDLRRWFDNDETRGIKENAALQGSPFSQK